MLVALLGCQACPLPKNTPELVTFQDPLSGEEHAKLGAIYEREGNQERAMQEYTRALKKDPENKVALTGLGNLALLRNQPRTAAAYYRRALAQDENNPAVLNNLAMAWIMAQKPKKAVAAADRAVSLDTKNDPRILDTRAQARLLIGDREGAREDWARAAAGCISQEKDLDLEAACAEIVDRHEQYGKQ